MFLLPEVGVADDLGDIPEEQCLGWGEGPLLVEADLGDDGADGDILLALDEVLEGALEIDDLLGVGLLVLEEGGELPDDDLVDKFLDVLLVLEDEGQRLEGQNTLLPHLVEVVGQKRSDHSHDSVLELVDGSDVS